MYAVIIEEITATTHTHEATPKSRTVVGPFSSISRAMTYQREAIAKRDRARLNGGDYRIVVAEMRSPRTYVWLPWETRQGSLADVLPFPGQARTSDPKTSQDAAKLITARATSARIRLLQAHAALDHERGLTDEEAAEAAGLDLGSEYATRCSELRALGVLEDLDIHRLSRSGMMRQARRITDMGRNIVRARNG